MFFFKENHCYSTGGKISRKASTVLKIIKGGFQLPPAL